MGGITWLCDKYIRIVILNFLIIHIDHIRLSRKVGLIGKCGTYESNEKISMHSYHDYITSIIYHMRPYICTTPQK